MFCTFQSPCLNFVPALLCPHSYRFMDREGSQAKPLHHRCQELRSPRSQEVSVTDSSIEEQGKSSQHLLSASMCSLHLSSPTALSSRLYKLIFQYRNSEQRHGTESCRAGIKPGLLTQEPALTITLYHRAMEGVATISVSADELVKHLGLLRPES